MSKILTDILYKVRLKAVQGSTGIVINKLCIDSRQVSTGACFIAIVGIAADGHQFIDIAIEKGATAIICQTMPITFIAGITYIQVANTNEAVAWMSHHFYDEPSSKLKLVGVTGTNGKTTVATLLFKLFASLGYTCV